MSMSNETSRRDMPAELAKKLQAARASRQMSGERRIITILFCDVAGSTAMASELDPEEWAEIMDDAFDFLIAPIFRYEGTLARLMGDAILAFFGAPIAHEDDPQRAILAGLDIINEIQPYRQIISREYGLDFNVRVGINTGPVVVGEVGSDLALEYTALGDAINTAARMESTAQPGTVQIAEDTHKLISPLFKTEALGPLELKGKPEAVQAYRVLRTRKHPGTLRGIKGLEAPLIGRQHELALLEQALEQSSAGQGHIAFLLGEAGLGKSRLIAELHDSAAAIHGDSLFWLTAHGIPYETKRPYSLAIQAVGDIAGIRREDSPEQVRRRISQLCQIMPDRDPAITETALEALFLGEGASSAPVEGEALKRALFQFTAGQIAAQVREKIGLLIFDDLHWADPASVELLTHLFRLVEREPVLIICAMRPYRDSEGWTARDGAAAVDPDYIDIELAPLTEDDSDDLVSTLLSVADLPADLRRLILRKAEGNPFFVEEVVRHLLDLGVVVRDEGDLHWRSTTTIQEIDIPDNLQALLISRIDRLGKEARRTLQLASVIGRSFYERVLATISDRSEGLPENLALLQTADLIRQVTVLPEPQFAFRHELTRDATYRTILRRDRRHYHRRVAEAIENLMADRLSEEAHLLAYHFREARQREKAQAYFTMAGELAARLYANGEAAEYFKEAIVVARKQGTVDQLIHLYAQRGRSLELDGQYDEALSNYQELEELGRDRAEPKLRLEALLSLALLAATPTSAHDPELAGELVQAALSLAEELDDPKSLTRGYWISGLRHGSYGDTQASVDDFEEARDLARKHGLQEQLAYILNDLSSPYVFQYRLVEALDALQEAGELFEALDNLPMLVDNRSNYATTASYFLPLNEAHTTCVQALTLARKIGSRWGEAYATGQLGLIYMQQGRISLAVQTLEKALELAALAEFTAANVYIPIILFLMRAYLFDQTGMERELIRVDKAMELFPELPLAKIFSLVAHHWHKVRLGDFEEAGQLWAELIHVAGHGSFVALMPPIYLAPADCESELLIGHYESALKCAREYIAVFKEKKVRRLRDYFHLIEGQALQALDRYREAEQAYTLGLEAADQTGARIVRWRIHNAMAGLAHARNEPEAADIQRELARAEIRFLLAEIDDDNLRDAFLKIPEVTKLRLSEASTI
jgi:class 3 adenylate cyclase/tetratricopeptide (TPR) repeat protein